MACFRLLGFYCCFLVVVIGETLAYGRSAGGGEDSSLETVEQVLGQMEEKVPLADADMRPHKMVYRTLKVAKRGRRKAAKGGRAAVGNEAPQGQDGSSPKKGGN